MYVFLVYFQSIDSLMEYLQKVILLSQIALRIVIGARFISQLFNVFVMSRIRCEFQFMNNKKVLKLIKTKVATPLRIV